MNFRGRVLTAIARPRVGIGVLAVCLGIGGLIGIRAGVGKRVAIEIAHTTVADLEPLHAEVRVRGEEVRGTARLLDGDDVRTSGGGRARLRLDDGTLVIVDENAELTLRGARITLARGRLFVQAGTSSRTEVVLKDSVASVVSSAIAFDAGEGGRGPSAYCARGELVITTKGRSTHVQSGETATLDPAGAKVAPETAFDDWTGGLAVPWSGERAPASAIAELWGGTDVDPGSPLVVRSENVDVTIEGEVSITRTRTTYFNGSDRDVQADVRLALPDGAIVSRVARLDEGAPRESNASLAVGVRNGSGANAGSRIEWAGGGWLRGTLTGIQAGKTVELFVDYVEWLSEKSGHATYRFPMASGGEGPMVGSLALRVTSQAPAKWLSASSGARVVDGAIEVRGADVRPTGDLVVEMVPDLVRANVARAYVEKAEPNEDPYVLVRTEVPDVADSGVTLALVLDSSSSVGPASLEIERAAALAIVDALGPKDSVVVLAADQSVVVVGPDKPSHVTPDVRARIEKELALVRPGGASNLGLALERAADLLDVEQGVAEPGSAASMVVYLGDGRPTVGEASGRDLRKRLARRAGGVPRLGALAIGQDADRWLLAELVAGAGPVYDVLDRPDGARASAALLAEALTPTLRDVSLNLGASVDRTYPREARTVASGSTLTMAGRLRGPLPKEIGLRYRRGGKLVEETRPLELVASPAFADVSRRWAKERIDDSVGHPDGVEPAIALAAKSKLLTPWTGWFFDGGTTTLPWEERLLGLSPARDTAFARSVEPARRPPSLLLEPPTTFGGEATIEQAAEIAARHSIDASRTAMVACRDARASIKPGISGDLRIDVALAPDGRPSRVTVTASRSADDDLVLDRCIRGIVDVVPFYGAGVAISFSHALSLPPPRSTRRTECSVASTLPLAVRRGIWRARKAKGTLDYFTAARTCEAPTWGERRTLLGILVAGLGVQPGMTLASRLATEGEPDAASFVREELVRATNFDALGSDELRRLIIGDEPKIDRALDKAFRAASSNEARLAVVHRFLRLAPHSPLGRRLLLSQLEATDRGRLLEAIERIRYDGFADAGLLAECASALRRLGMDQEGRRVFGELVERAPRDPWTLGYVGDRLRAEGLYEDALAAYIRLDAATPDDPAVALRLALAHAGAGRLDVATRLLDRVAQTGGRGDDGRLGELAAVVSASLLATAREGAPGAETDALLVRRLAQTALPDVASVILVRTPLGDDKVEVSVARRDKDKDELPADLDASAMGLSAVRIERGGGVARIRLRRPSALVGGRPTRGIVTALVLDKGDRSHARVVSREVNLAAGDTGTELRWNGEAFE